MNKALGISGYFLLILSAAFLDIPFLGLLAIPTFLIGVILLLIFYLKLIDIKKSFMWVSIILVVIGVLMLSGALGYSAVEFTAKHCFTICDKFFITIVKFPNIMMAIAIREITKRKILNSFMPYDLLAKY